MRKATALLVTALGVLALVGAGCSNTQEEVNPNEEKGTATNTQPSENTQKPEEQAAAEIVASAESLGNGVVSVKWTVPENFDRTKSFQVLHSSKPNPDHPSAFWFQYMNSERATELSNIATGTRYIRVCSFDLEKKECVKYSNEVQLEVK
jgi:hypothetical protein